jgi:hypothetical protein
MSYVGNKYRLSAEMIVGINGINSIKKHGTT